MATANAMEAGSDACTRVLALASAPMRAIMAATTSKSDAGADPAADARTALADFAAAHPDDAFVQWMAATQGDAPARTRLQRLEPDNAAAWLRQGFAEPTVRPRARIIMKARHEYGHGAP